MPDLQEIIMIFQPGDLIEYTPWDKKENMPLIEERVFAVVTDVNREFIIVKSARYTCPEVIQRHYWNALKVKLVSRPEPEPNGPQNL
tara:strand:- start:550 stop:810 length:261 start_codon:yes stop_codon:yes gene_type:complete